MRPLESFIRLQAASGIVLLACAAIALTWANTRWGASYDALWNTQLQLAVGSWQLGMSLHSFVNDVLMAIFFFVIGLEVRREIYAGELSSVRRAALPLIAAIGGMAIPAAIYVLVGPADARSGWAVPVSTDTAFALGIFALLGARIAPPLRVLLLAIAIIDDILAILIIAIFYSSGLHAGGAVVAIVGVIAILALQWLGVRHVLGYAVPAMAVWAGCWWAGIHPTVAGILVGLLTPASTWYGHQGFLDAAYRHLGTIEHGPDEASHGAMDIKAPMSALRRAQRESVSPVARLEGAMHAWAAFAIMPLFAFANAGVDLGRVDLATSPRIVAGIACGLVAGKLAGILGAVWIAVKLGLTELPPRVTWRGIVVLGAVAGVGFTMALFIANLAFHGQAALQDVSTVAVLLASAIAGMLALALGRVLLAEHEPDAADEDATAPSSG